MKREGLFHGDLRRALALAGVEFAKQGGPEAITVRAATRVAGVAPSAAYRHFENRDELVLAVAQVAQTEVANRMAALRDTLLQSLDTNASAADRAQTLLYAVGRAYLEFAWDEPGLFRTAFGTQHDLINSAASTAAGADGLTPFQHLSAALDALLEAGVLSAHDRPGAEALAWSSVHGFAHLTIGGPLRALPPEQRSDLGDRVIAMASDGILHR
ncbi:TetR/AcrR family transcriptional regulator [Humidisolicoccus flavus]|uniref:TetR/AcrR family transcriptional regulator n=1 Tax=Humidisolicoccus flavus TaxID=3111414 RepID=UPI00324A8AEF